MAERNNAMSLSVKVRGSEEAMDLLRSKWGGELADITDENDEIIPEWIERLSKLDISVEVRTSPDEYEYGSNAFRFD